MDVILYAIPIFIITLLIEVLYYRHLGKHQDHYDPKDTASSLTMGIGNVLTGLVSKFLVFGALVFVYKFRIFELDRTWVGYWIMIFSLTISVIIGFIGRVTKSAIFGHLMWCIILPNFITSERH